MSITDIQRHRIGPDAPERIRDREPTYSELMDQAIAMAERNVKYGEAFHEIRKISNKMICDLRIGTDPEDEARQEQIDEFDCALASVYARIYAQ